MNAAVYCRISKDRAGEGLGVARQEEDARALCEARGWVPVEVFTDNDVSAYSGAPRPGYQALLDAVRAGRVDAIVAWHPDRLHRSPRELEDFIALVEEHGTEVATVRSGELDLSSASGRMTARVVGAVARHESEQKSERIRRALEQRARAGKPHGPGRPFGFEQDRVTVVEEEAALLREAARRVLAGESMTSIVRDWNDRGVSPPQGGSSWRVSTWRRMMLNPRLAGLRAYKGEVVGEAQWQAILNRRQWEAVKAKLTPKREAGRRAEHLLSGLARCGRCDGPLWSAQTKDRLRYRCFKRPGHDGCGRLSVSATPVERLVRDAVLTAISGPALAEARRQVASDDADQARAAESLADAEERLEQVAEMFADGTLSRREWLAARERLEERVEDARRTLDRHRQGGMLATLPADTDALTEVWEDRDVHWRRSLLEAIVERIIVHPAEPGGTFDPGRVEILWRV